MTKVLVSDPIDQAGIDILGQVAQVDQRTGLSPDELKAIIGDYDALMIRSGTQVTADVIAAADRLRIIGRAGVGVDNVDVPAATQRGVLVVNSPEGNTIAAAEHALALLLSLSRHVPQAHASMRQGAWDRKKYVGNELYKKTLGVVGLGKIGSHVARVAKAMGMDVIAFDPFISADRAQQMQVRLTQLNELFRTADYITLHIPRTPDTENLVNVLEFSAQTNVALWNRIFGIIYYFEIISFVTGNIRITKRVLSLYNFSTPCGPGDMRSTRWLKN